MLDVLELALLLVRSYPIGAREVARKYHIQRVTANAPSVCAILLEEMDIGCGTESRLRIQVHSEFLRANDCVYELAVPAAEVENRCVLWNPARKERAENVPDFLPIFKSASEPGTVEVLQVIGRMRKLRHRTLNGKSKCFFQNFTLNRDDAPR